MSFTYSLHPSIDAVDEAEWDQLLRPEGDLFMDRRYIRAVEHAMSDRVKFWYVTIRDTSHLPVATACLHAWFLDLRLVVSGWPRSALEVTRRIYPRVGRRKWLCCGLPVPTGESSLRIDPNTDVGEVVGILSQLLLKIASTERAKSIILLEFAAEEVDRLVQFTTLGYLRGESSPMNIMEAPFHDFDDYCRNLNSRKRYAIRKSRQKFSTSGLCVVHLKGSDGITQLYSDDVHELFLEVAQTKKRLHEVPASFFRELASQMPDETSFTLIYNGTRVAAFAASLCAGGMFQQLFVGFDHKLNPKYDLYFNLFFNTVDYALRQNIDSLLLGQGSDTFKQQKLGAHQQPRYYFFNALGKVRAALAAHALDKVFTDDVRNTPVQPNTS